MCIYEVPTPLGENFWVFASTKEKGSDSGYLFVTEEIASDNINIVISRMILIHWSGPYFKQFDWFTILSNLAL